MIYINMNYQRMYMLAASTIISMLCINCSSDNDAESYSNPQIISINQEASNSEQKGSELFSSTSLIKLGESKGVEAIGRVIKVQVHNDRVYILDGASPRAILAFSLNDGMFIGQLSSIDTTLRISGDAMFNDFSIDVNGNIHILDDINESIYTTDLNLNIIKQKNTSGYFDKIQTTNLKEEYLLYKNKTANNFEDSTLFYDVVHVIDDTARNMFFPFMIPQGAFTRVSSNKPLSLNQSNGTVNYYSFLSDTIWSFSNGQMNIAYQIDFGDQSLPLSWKELPMDLLLRKLRTKENEYAFGVSEWIENKYIIGFQYIYNQKPYFFFKKKQGNDTYIGNYIYEESLDYPLPFPTFAGNNTLYGILDEVQLEKLLVTANPDKLENSPIYQNIVNQGHTYLIKYEL